MKKIIDRKYYWLAYPVISVFLTGVIGVWIFGQGGVWDRVLSTRKEINQLRTDVERLEEKKILLQQVGDTGINETLKVLLQAVPVVKQVLPLVSGLGIAAGRSGVILEGYAAVGGETRGQNADEEGEGAARVEANIAGSWPDVLLFIRESEKLLPMRRVTELTFNSGKSRVALESRYSPLLKVEPVGNEKLDYKAKLNEAMVILSRYELAGVATASGGGTTNPGLF
ncbi:MAG: hypothetical protein G01um101416_456 [Microgenomates group bacterium Gr01-1014_16]|nr:MAG: hypothetical protein G01um101416_456 [Microgenomates group bacterium Gr01-1014_16]